MENILNAGNLSTKVRVIERNGLTLGAQLCNRTPWRYEKCSNQECIPCATHPGSCRSKNLTYRLTCVSCAVKGVSSCYIGESHRAWEDRALEHHRAMEKFDRSYATVRHYAEMHPNETPQFTFHKWGHICQLLRDKSVNQ